MHTSSSPSANIDSAAENSPQQQGSFAKNDCLDFFSCESSRWFFCCAVHRTLSTISFLVDLTYVLLLLGTEITSLPLIWRNWPHVQNSFHRILARGVCLTNIFKHGFRSSIIVLNYFPDGIFMTMLVIMTFLAFGDLNTLKTLLVWGVIHDCWKIHSLDS